MALVMKLIRNDNKKVKTPPHANKPVFFV